MSYRLRNGIDHRAVRMAVVVQRMVCARAAGVMFTADPVTSNRRVLTVEAAVGLGDGLVTGVVKADVYKVRDGAIVEQAPAAKPVLSAPQVVQLARLGRRVEAHFGDPQDIEWCVDDDGFQVVQCRPITTLFPIPAADDGENHVYLSVGHQQMMTDPMKPLGLSFWQMTTPRPMAEAGGRLFIDVASRLASPTAREALLGMFGKSDPLTVDALRSILARGDFIPTLPDAVTGETPPAAPTPAPSEIDPAIVTELIARTEASIASLKREIAPKSGSALLEFILADVATLRRILFDPQSHAVFMTAMEAAWWLGEHLRAWLDEKNAADTLTQSLPHNVTSEMGLALLDVADAVRPHPEVVAFLRAVEGGGIDGAGFPSGLVTLPGGVEAREAIEGWLERYGMRCVGEIDITRPRWSEQPAALVPLILSNVKNFEPGESARRFERGRREAQRREYELLERLRSLPDGERKAQETARMIARVRTLMGYREYPKYGMVCRYAVYKQALLAEAERLVEAGVLRGREDIFMLRFEELRDVVRSHRVDYELIRRRKAEFRRYGSLAPPRVLTSDGEALSGSQPREDAPDGALLGVAVSSGTAEGRARVIRDVTGAALEPGDILVTAYTDPSWTPAFVTIAALVTEVGGVMTHGAVIAREYGLPAVVNVAHATELIEDGQRIRVNGTEGYVEILCPARRSRASASDLE